MAEQSMGYLRCTEHRLEIIRIEFAKRVRSCLGFRPGTGTGIYRPGSDLRLGRSSVLGNEDNEETSAIWPAVGNGENLFVSVVLGETQEDIRTVLDGGRKELERRYSALPSGN